jgi:hypothetical protein
MESGTKKSGTKKSGTKKSGQKNQINFFKIKENLCI